MLITQKIENLLNGVSQQAATVRLPSQGEEQINALSSVGQGLTKRPPSRHVAQITATPTDYDTAFIHTFVRSSGEKYKLFVVGGDLKVFNALTGVESTVQFPDGKTYLSDTGTKGFRAITIGDSTVITNRNTAVATLTTRAPEARKEALIWVRQADYGTTYRVTLDGAEYSYKTPDGADASERPQIATADIADQLLQKIGSPTGFTIVRYGSSIHLSKTDNSDFSLSTEDGLGDRGLIIIKGSVQSFEDLPPKARPGMIVEVTGDPTTDFDNAWLVFDDALTGGVWRETVEPNTLTSLNPATMPHQLVYLGSLYGEVVGQGIFPPGPEVTVVENYKRPGGWTLNSAGASVSPVVSHQMTTNGDFYQCVLPTSTVTQDVTAWYNVNTINVVAGVTLTVTMDYWAASAWTNVSSVVHHAGLYVSDQQITGSVPVGTGTKIRLLITYSTPPSLPSEIAIVELPHFGIGNDVVSRIAVPTALRVKANPLTIYPQGMTLTVNEAYVITGSDDNGAELLEGLKAALVLAGTYTILKSTDGLLEFKNASGTIPSGSWSRAMTGGIWHFPGANFPAGVVGKVLTNATDGSSGTITARTTTTLTVTLTGGTDNEVQDGDICSIANAGVYFTFKQAEWRGREVGSLTVNPFPSIVTRTVDEVFFESNRLGMTSGYFTVLSVAGDLFNLFRQTALNLLDDDPIDVQSSHPVDSRFHSAVQWNDTTYLFSSVHMAHIAGDPLLSPKTIQLPSVVNVETDPGARPVIIGSRILIPRAYTFQGATYTRVTEAWFNQGGLIETDDLTRHVPTYLPGSPIRLTAESASGKAFLLTDADQSVLFVYSTFMKGGERQMASWSKWQFPAGSTIIGVDMLDNELTLVIHRSDGVYFESLDLDQGNSGSDAKIQFIDRRITGVQSAAVSAVVYASPVTTWTLPYEVPTNGSQGEMVVVNRATNAVLVTTRPSATTVAVSGYGDLSATSVWIGVLYEFSYTFSKLYSRNREGTPETRGRLQVRYLDLHYHNTTDATLTVSPDDDRADKALAIDTATAGEGSIHIPVQMRNTYYTLIIADETPGACSFSAVDWEGDYTTRAQRL